MVLLITHTDVGDVYVWRVCITRPTPIKFIPWVRSSFLPHNKRMVLYHGLALAWKYDNNNKYGKGKRKKKRKDEASHIWVCVCVCITKGFLLRKDDVLEKVYTQEDNIYVFCIKVSIWTLFLCVSVRLSLGCLTIMWKFMKIEEILFVSSIRACWKFLFTKKVTTVKVIKSNGITEVKSGMLLIEF